MCIRDSRIDEPTALPEFNVDRFAFQPELSDAANLVFTRDFIPAGAKG